MASKFPINPASVRLSRHFLLSDFMGCDSVYARGLNNPFVSQYGVNDPRIVHGQTLCEEILEPLLEWGPMSIGYGFISPELSQEIVKYQDPKKPSYHRWELGGTADICMHNIVQAEYKRTSNPSDNLFNSPIYAAMSIACENDLPFSRMITYSESPYICISANTLEVSGGNPRRAFYEYRYPGKPKTKPKKIDYPTTLAVMNGRERLLQDRGFTWKHAGYPTYHGGGHKGLHHIRTSYYTMASDFLYDKDLVYKGIRNMPMMGSRPIEDAFAAAGKVYDRLVDETEIYRFSIVRGFLSHLAPGCSGWRDWRNPVIGFALIPPDGDYSQLRIGDMVIEGLMKSMPGVSIDPGYLDIEITFEVDNVLRQDW